MGAPDGSPGGRRCGPGPNPPADAFSSECRSHADCTEEARGRCAQNGLCFYDDCWTDADCAPDQRCLCSDHPESGYNWAYCVESRCHSDDDCPEDSLCRWSKTDCGFGVQGYYCTTAADTCREDADCPVEEYCMYRRESGRWACAGTTCSVP